MVRRFHITIVIILACILNSYSQQYSFKSFPEVTNLQQSYIYSLSQDSLGYLWVGTDNGLFRYDGSKFSVYTTEDSLGDNFVTCMIRDHRSMWYGHMNGSVSVFKDNVFRNFTGIPDAGPITAVNRSTSGMVWFSTYTGKFFSVDPETGIAGVTSFKEEESVTAFCFTGHDSMLIGTGTGLYTGSPGKKGILTGVKKVQETEGYKIVQLLKAASGKGFYAATENNGIYLLSGNGRKIEKVNTGSLGIEGIESISEDSQGFIWAGTFGNGLLRIEPATGIIQRFNDRLINENVRTVYTDKEGNTWCGNYGTGLTMVIPVIFSLYRFDENIGNYVTAVCSAGNYTWIGTSNGLVKLDKDFKVNRFLPGAGRYEFNTISALFMLGKYLWIGTDKKGLFRMDTATMIPVHISIGNGDLENSITSLACIQNYLWIGTKKGLCSYKTDGTETKWFSINRGGLPHNSINSLFADSRGRLWVSSRSNILAYILDGKIHKIQVNPGNSALSFGPVAEDANNHIWAGSLGKGIFQIDGDSMINVNTGSGLLSDYCYAMISGKNNYLWVSHKGGLSRVSTITYHAKVIEHIDKSYEKINFTGNAITMDNFNRITAGSETGLVAFNLTAEVNAPVPVPEIISLKINDREYVYDGDVVLKPGKYKIDIEYQAINLREPEKVIYSVFLRGYDQVPEITNSNSVTYQNLDAGDYAIVINSLSEDGVISENQASLRILIRTPLWAQWWFYLLLCIIIFFLIVVLIKRREFRFRTEKTLLEEKVLERTREIQQQKNELELQKDLISIKNAEITSSIRYALEIQNAVLPGKSTVDKFLHHNFIYLKPKDIVSGDFYWLTRKNDRIIFTVADCTGHGVPGAFMSVLSISTLNEIVNIEGVTQSNKIVNKLHTMINKALKNSRMDGLDLSLCVYDIKNRKLQYTGAMNSLVYFRNGELNVLKADPFSVNMVREDFKSFSFQEIGVLPGDVVYLYTDGYMDQFGGPKDKKYSINRFYNTLCAIHTLPMHEQEIQLDHIMSEWKKDRVQTDDITVMGIRF